MPGATFDGPTFACARVLTNRATRPDIKRPPGRFFLAGAGSPPLFVRSGWRACRSLRPRRGLGIGFKQFRLSFFKALLEGRYLLLGRSKLRPCFIALCKQLSC